MELNEIQPIVNDKAITDKAIVNDKFHDAEFGPDPESESDSEIELDEDKIQLDDELVKQLKHDISKNYGAIADLKLKEDGSGEITPSSPTTPISSLSRESYYHDKKKKRKPKPTKKQ